MAIQLVDWISRGVSQVMFVNNPVSGLLITAGLFLQDPWWALNGLLGTFVSTVSALLLGQNRSDYISICLLDFIVKKNKHFHPDIKSLSLSLPLKLPGATLSLVFTLCYFHSVFLILMCFTHLSHSPQESRISGFIWLQWNPGWHIDGCFLHQRKLVLVAVIAKCVHVHVVVSVLLNLIRFV